MCQSGYKGGRRNDFKNRLNSKVQYKIETTCSQEHAHRTWKRTLYLEGPPSHVCRMTCSVPESLNVPVHAFLMMHDDPN